MVLDDVPQRSCSLVELAAPFDADALGDDHLDMVDVAAIPDRFEDRVGKAQGKDVLDRLFSHVVVDPEDLLFVEMGVDLGHQLPGALQVDTEGLLDDEAGEAAALAGLIEPGISKPANDPGEVFWGDGEVKDAVSGRAPGLVEAVEELAEARKGRCLL